MYNITFLRGALLNVLIILWPDILNRISLRLWEMRHNFFLGVKSCGVKLTSHYVIIQRLRWVTPSLPHIPSWHWQEQFTFCLFLELIYLIPLDQMFWKYSVYTISCYILQGKLKFIYLGSEKLSKVFYAFIIYINNNVKCLKALQDRPFMNSD